MYLAGVGLIDLGILGGVHFVLRRRVASLVLDRHQESSFRQASTVFWSLSCISIQHKHPHRSAVPQLLTIARLFVACQLLWMVFHGPICSGWELPREPPPQQ